VTELGDTVSVTCTLGIAATTNNSTGPPTPAVRTQQRMNSSAAGTYPRRQRQDTSHHATQTDTESRTRANHHQQQHNNINTTTAPNHFSSFKISALSKVPTIVYPCKTIHSHSPTTLSQSVSAHSAHSPQRPAPANTESHCSQSGQPYIYLQLQFHSFSLHSVTENSVILIIDITAGSINQLIVTSARMYLHSRLPLICHTNNASKT